MGDVPEVRGEYRGVGLTELPPFVRLDCPMCDWQSTVVTNDWPARRVLAAEYDIHFKLLHKPWPVLVGLSDNDGPSDG